MAEYIYSALNEKGEEIKGILDAADKTDAITQLRELGVFPTEVRNRSGCEPSEERSAETDEAIRRYLDSPANNTNIFAVIKNAIRRKLLFGTFKKDKNPRDMR